MARGLRSLVLMARNRPSWILHPSRCQGAVETRPTPVHRPFGRCVGARPVRPLVRGLTQDIAGHCRIKLLHEPFKPALPSVRSSPSAETSARSTLRCGMAQKRTPGECRNTRGDFTNRSSACKQVPRSVQAGRIGTRPRLSGRRERRRRAAECLPETPSLHRRQCWRRLPDLRVRPC